LASNPQRSNRISGEQRQGSAYDIIELLSEFSPGFQNELQTSSWHYSFNGAQCSREGLQDGSSNRNAAIWLGIKLNTILIFDLPRNTTEKNTDAGKMDGKEEIC
jgi:hypothetical protein